MSISFLGQYGDGRIRKLKDPRVTPSCLAVLHKNDQFARWRVLYRTGQGGRGDNRAVGPADGALQLLGHAVVFLGYCELRKEKCFQSPIVQDVEFGSLGYFQHRFVQMALNPKFRKPWNIIGVGTMVQGRAVL